MGENIASPLPREVHHGCVRASVPPQGWEESLDGGSVLRVDFFCCCCCFFLKKRKVGFGRGHESTLQIDTFIYYQPQASNFPFQGKCRIYSSKGRLQWQVHSVGTGLVLKGNTWEGEIGQMWLFCVGTSECFTLNSVFPHQGNWICFGFQKVLRS